MSRKNYGIAAFVLLVIFLIWWIIPGAKTQDSILVRAEQGEFKISVTTTGELDSQFSTEIVGPQNLRNIEIYSEIKLENIIPEGTVVDSGDFIASLDKTVVMNRLDEIDANIEKLNTQITNSKLDSALTLRAARDNIINLHYSTEEMALELENSRFEAPAIQRQAEIDLEKAVRNYEQAVEGYLLRKEKEETTIQQIMIDLKKQTNVRKQTMAILREFTIKAQQPGMVIYAKTRRGEKIETGSMISPWRPVIAKLPDLTRMLVKTYVNEIDISKIKVGQNVEIGVDAFPGKELKGKVTAVANIGEELRNSSANVFEVTIFVDGSDESLRPAMTTKNVIVTEVLNDMVFIPLECLYVRDSVQYVYVKGAKKLVETGKSNDNSIVITKGMETGDELYLLPPEGASEWKIKD
ncbi:MAG: efflux RND transporter periplasmic adaptor subunit [Bacteroidales bacterium]|jgi:HlyD family secretion protein|nr:efflux RND transporter periplasmic adaptor subunit [Bacteroidales bacterium]